MPYVLCTEKFLPLFGKAGYLKLYAVDCKNKNRIPVIYPSGPTDKKKSGNHTCKMNYKQ